MELKLKMTHCNAVLLDENISPWRTDTTMKPKLEQCQPATTADTVEEQGRMLGIVHNRLGRSEQHACAEGRAQACMHFFNGMVKTKSKKTSFLK
jgi:hypothetical protein